MDTPENAIARLTDALLNIDRFAARQILMAPAPSQSPIQRIEESVVPALEHIGKLWEQGTASLSQVYMSGRICEEIVDELLPPAAAQRKTQPTMAIAVLNDYHLLGKRIVHTLLRASGYEILDYGRMEPGPLAERTKQDQVRILLVSTLMLHSALKVAELRNLLMEQKHPMVRIVVGGAPFRFDPALYQQVGADAVGFTASDAIACVEKMIGGAV